MMRNFTYVCAIISLLAGWSSGEELPREVERLISKRNEAVTKIDRTMVEELEKLKLQYTKDGDLEAANKTVELIDLYTDASLKEELAGKWRIYDTKNPAYWTGIVTITRELSYSCQGSFGTPNNQGNAGKVAIDKENKKIILGLYEFDASSISKGKLFATFQGDPRTLERVK